MLRSAPLTDPIRSAPIRSTRERNALDADKALGHSTAPHTFRALETTTVLTCSLVAAAAASLVHWTGMLWYGMLGTGWTRLLELESRDEIR